MEAVASFMSMKRSEGAGGKPAADDDTGSSTCLLLITACSRQHTSTTRFAADGGYWTIVFEVEDICRRIHEFC